MRYRDEIKYIYKQEGLYGFTRGYSGLFIRDFFGFGCFFFMFDTFKHLFKASDARYEYLKGKKHHNNDDLSRFSLMIRKMLAGGLAGVVSWTFGYPWDMVKSIQQTHRGPNRLHAFTVAREIYKVRGIFSIYRGLHI
mmetsp:Transcript_893/g.920  ORF Transcript_893/g.920 Transcript_893/m.920 type:complete len:137 (-) Transcript_893:124-534(-)